MDSLLVKEIAIQAGAAVVGIACADDFALAPEGCRPADQLEGCRSVIVLGIPFPREALEMDFPGHMALRNEMIRKMTALAKEVAKRVKAGGCKTKAISAIGGKFVEGKHWGHISLKHAAELDRKSVV